MHLYRHQIRDTDVAQGATYPENVLIGHYQMHLVPNVTSIIQNPYSYAGSSTTSDKQYLTHLGIIEPAVTDKQN